MRKAAFGLQSNLDRDFHQILACQSALSGVGADTQHILLADVEVHVDRLLLNDGGENGRRAGTANKFADRDLPRRHDTVERS